MGGGWPEFIRYAKTWEQLVNQSDPWGFQEKDVQRMRNAWNDGKKLLKKSKDPVLNARIAYQMVRLVFYAPELKLDAQAVCDKDLAPLRGKTWLEPSAAFYVASMKENPDRDLAYAELFDRAAGQAFPDDAAFRKQRNGELHRLGEKRSATRHPAGDARPAAPRSRTEGPGADRCMGSRQPHLPFCCCAAR